MSLTLILLSVVKFGSLILFTLPAEEVGGMVSVVTVAMSPVWPEGCGRASPMKPKSPSKE